MNPEVKPLWLKALRSGDYKQGNLTLQLRKDNGCVNFCCLGVLSHLGVEAGVIAPPTFKPSASLGGERGSYGDGVHNSTYLPDAVAQWAGCKFDPSVMYEGEVTTLSKLNDAGKSFLEIADIIEKQL